MTYKQLESAIMAILPSASFEEDNYGQVIIYTGLQLPKTTEGNSYDQELEQFEE